MRIRDKRGVSPIIATVLLIMIVIILAIIILLWSRGFIKEVMLKEINGEEKNVELRCSEISIRPIVDGGSFGFENNGNVPISSFKLKTTDINGDSATEEIPSRVNPGFNTMIEGKSTSSYTEISIIPVILGKKQSGQIEEFECPESSNFRIYSSSS